MTEMGEVLKAIGRLEANTAGLREDFNRERSETRENRRAQYIARDKTDKRLEAVESSLAINTGITAQTRDTLTLIVPKVEAATATLKSWKIRGGFALTGAGMLGAALWYLLKDNAPALWHWITHS